MIIWKVARHYKKQKEKIINKKQGESFAQAYLNK